MKRSKMTPRERRFIDTYISPKNVPDRHRSWLIVNNQPFPFDYHGPLVDKYNLLLAKALIALVDAEKDQA